MTPTEVMVREAYFQGYNRKSGFAAIAAAVDDHVTQKISTVRVRLLAARSECDDLRDTVDEMHKTIQQQNDYIAKLKAQDDGRDKDYSDIDYDTRYF